MIKKILILGGSGLLGKIVAEQLLKDGYSVKIFDRNLSTSFDKESKNIEFIQGDVASRQDLKDALLDCDAVHISLTYSAELIAVKNIVSLLDEINLKKISYISGSTTKEENAFFPTTRDKLLAENLIKDSGVSYQIFRPTFFIESIPRFVADGRATVLGKQVEPYHLLSAVDFAKIVSKRFSDTRNSCEQVFGEQAITLEDALKIYIERRNPEIKKVAHLPYFVARIIALLTKDEKLKDAIDFLSYLEKVGENYSPNATICKTTAEETFTQKSK